MSSHYQAKTPLGRFVNELEETAIAVLLAVLAISNPPENIGLVALICFVILILGPTLPPVRAHSLALQTFSTFYRSVHNRMSLIFAHVTRATSWQSSGGVLPHAKISQKLQ